MLHYFPVCGFATCERICDNLTRMASIPDITDLPRGARFVRADVHIHSYLGSHDVKDATATPEAIVATAAKEGLQVIAITDHNEIGNVAAAITAARSLGLFLIPAIELSAPEGHLLSYLPTLDALQRFYGQIDIGDRGTQNSHCRNSMLDCLNKLQAFGGFGILAHVDGPSGLASSALSRYSDQPHRARAPVDRHSSALRSACPSVAPNTPHAAYVKLA
jgi:hypothetical protein